MLRFKVEDMSCAHCVATIDRTVKDLDADARVECDLATKTVSVTTTLDPAAIQAALEEAGYEAVPIAG
jgi:copper chaperone